MKTLLFAISFAALALSSGCSVIWFAEGNDDGTMESSSSSTGSTSSSSSGSGTGGEAGTGGGGTGGSTTCTPTNWVDAGVEATGCGALPVGNCDVTELPPCSEQACGGKCRFYDRCTPGGWVPLAFCEGSMLVSTMPTPPDAGKCTPPDLDTAGATTGCGPVPDNACPESDAKCVETACDGECQFYDECTPTGWLSVAFCEGSTLKKL